MALKICVIILLLACIVTSLGWLTTRWELEAANGQYAYSLEELSRLAQIANGQVRLNNQQIAVANATIGQVNTTMGQLEQELAESEGLVAYWRGRAYPGEFESLDELKAWLATDDTDSTLYIFGSGCLGAYDCDDYAVALMQNALLDGYSVSLQVEGNHMLNSTIIDNKIYFIEPQSDKVWLWGYRD